ncbi:hypothetical protein AMAG_07650 [Allomyces macrogynus ATCC 38327]|uniref:Uncharacterized protein n=1 Tax=Allomyces macrogynus (strain ATCC 38327) TaxID=578462 RepID=A0A0L0SIV0_ALLM3|nr:hypothetical protein AMAG_07650 [Allomyces macrogynus ATCC 38327]|eukprot:KNE62431.1 hypothetical protein AMAG_07650 [Allomyces macrogynus ATCC 38327]
MPRQFRRRAPEPPRPSSRPIAPPRPAMSASKAAIPTTGLLDLQTELLRTQHQVESAKARARQANKDAPSKLDQKFINALATRDRDRIRKEIKKPEKPAPTTRSDAPEWEQVQAALARKAEQYDRLKERGGMASSDEDEVEKNGDDEDEMAARARRERKRKRREEAAPLVDFLTKRYQELEQGGGDASSDDERSDSADDDDVVVSDQEERYRRRAERGRARSRSRSPSPSYKRPRYASESDEEDMVEITDEFGRARLVPRRYAHEYMPPQSPSPYDDYSDEDHGWRSPSPPAHFDSKREVRTMGVGYYALSTDAGERAEQMRALQDLREQTLEARRRAAEGHDPAREEMARRMRLILRRRAKKLGALRAQDVQWAVVKGNAGAV